jgi:hypothetical protein
VLRSVVALGLLLTSACGSDDEETEPGCIDVPATCDAQITPEYPQLYQQIFRSCAQAGACHAADNPQGGLDFSDIDRSYALLRGLEGGRPRVEPGNPGCGKLVVRTHSVGKPWQMPPGTPLTPFEQCSIRQWIENGAAREPTP